MLGVAAVDKEKAWQYYDRMRLSYIAEQFPDHWIGQWTSSDYINSSLAEYPGHSVNMMYNGHPHAYPLYLYYKLKEQ